MIVKRRLCCEFVVVSGKQRGKKNTTFNITTWGIWFSCIHSSPKISHYFEFGRARKAGPYEFRTLNILVSIEELHFSTIHRIIAQVQREQIDAFFLLLLLLIIIYYFYCFSTHYYPLLSLQSDKDNRARESQKHFKIAPQFFFFPEPQKLFVDFFIFVFIFFFEVA